MGITYVEGRVKGPSGKQENVKFLVDSGATYSLLPAQQSKDRFRKPLLFSPRGKLTHR